ncbi:MAG: hypothetical protein IIU35_04665 [Neisseriaceae bacterium]|nr:hypothetical protein [Neisseriaceae bacterium]
MSHSNHFFRQPFIVIASDTRSPTGQNQPFTIPPTNALRRCGGQECPPYNLLIFPRT